MLVVGIMPYLSSAPASSSSGRWLLVSSQGGLPQWKAAVGGGSGKSSSNKLGLGRLDLKKKRENSYCLLRCRVGGGEDGKGLNLDLLGLVIASELGVRRWIWSRYSCSTSSSLSTMFCGEDSAPASGSGT